MTRAELLQYYQSIDTSKLKNLYDYANFLILPQEDLLVNATMNTMYAKAMQLADVLFPEWTDRGSSDFGAFLIELMCLFSEKDFSYINIYSRESFLKTMSKFSSAYFRALELGYIPKVFEAGNALFKVTYSGGNTGTVPSGGIVLSRDSVNFTNIFPYDIPYSGEYASASMPLYAGKWVTKNYTYNGRPIYLSDQNIYLDSVVVYAGTTSYTKVISYGIYSSSAAIFYSAPENDASASIYFGDGTFGIKPSVGTVFTISYLAGDNTCLSSSDSTKPVTISTIPVLRNATSAIISSMVNGCVKQETIASVKASSQLIFRTQNRIINEKDCEEVLLSLSGIIKAKCVSYQNDFQFFVILADGTTANQTYMNVLSEKLNGNQLIGFGLKGSVTQFVPVTPLTIDIYCLKGYDLNIEAANAYNSIQEYLDPTLLADYGKNLIYYKLVNHIVSTNLGIQNVVVKTISGSSPDPSGQTIIQSTKITQGVPVSASPSITYNTNYITFSENGVTVNSHYSE